MNGRTERDEGAVMVFVAIMMVVMLGMSALVIDIGAAYVEKRELQNGADAAALAVAQECATATSCGTPNAMAEDYADANANDGHAHVTTICGVGPGLTPCTPPLPSLPSGWTGWVKVENSTETSSGGNQISFVLAPVINALAGATFDEVAIAAWGSLGAATTLNFIFSKCEWEYMGGNLATGTMPSGTSVIYSDNIATERCDGGSTPGNFGWIDANSRCEVPLTAGGTVTGNPGSNSELCSPASMYQNAEVVLPLFTGTPVLQGNRLRYTVAGFVGFKITGYYLTGQDRWNLNRCPARSGGQGGGNLRCFVGQFTRVKTSGDFGGGPNYGASVVKMIG